jgi:prepilin peptidase CpaA
MATVKLVVITSLAGGVLTVVVAGLHKYQRKQGRPEVPYGVAIAFGGLWLLAQRFLNHFA